MLKNKAHKQDTSAHKPEASHGFYSISSDRRGMSLESKPLEKAAL